MEVKYPSRKSTKTMRKVLSYLVLTLALVLWSDGGKGAIAFELSLDKQKLDEIVGTPPSTNSAALEADLAILHWLQKTRTSEDIATSWFLLDHTLPAFNTAVGADFSEKSTPEFTKTFDDISKWVKSYKDGYKNRFKRVRPYNAHKDLQRCVPPDDSFSYPSGHSTEGLVMGMLLSDLFPERKEEIMAVGREFGFARVVCGMHYPSDVMAGQRLATVLSEEVLRSSEWQQIRKQLEPEITQIRQDRPKALPKITGF